MSEHVSSQPFAAVDVVGHSQLARSDEDRTLARQQTLRR
jgi:hypothetical protein